MGSTVSADVLLRLDTTSGVTWLEPHVCSAVGPCSKDGGFGSLIDFQAPPPRGNAAAPGPTPTSAPAPAPTPAPAAVPVFDFQMPSQVRRGPALLFLNHLAIGFADILPWACSTTPSPVSPR